MSTEQHQIEQIEQLVQRSNNVVIWTDIPLFTSPFYRESYYLYPFWNSSRSKNCILVVKNTWFCSIKCFTQNETILPKKGKNKRGKLFIWILALSWGLSRTFWHTCHVMEAEHSDRPFGKNKPVFLFIFIFLYMYMCVLWGMWLYLYD